MKVQKIINYIPLVLILCMIGCYYDVEEELYPSIDCETIDISYNSDIVPILEANCYQCHSKASNFGNITLEGFSEVSKYVLNNALLGSIKHDAGFSPMPKNRGKILECEIEKINTWIADGALNN